MLPKCRTSLLSTVVNQCYQSVVLPVFLPFAEMLLKCRTSMRMLSIRCYLNVVHLRDIDW